MSTRSKHLITLLITLSGCTRSVSDGLDGDLAATAGDTGESPSAESTGDDAPDGSTHGDGGGDGDASDGSDDGSDGSDGSDGGDSSTGEAEVPCDAATHACVPLPPGSWEGPIVFHSLGDQVGPTECGGEWPVIAMAGWHGIDVAPASCECSCGAPVGAECETMVIPYTPFCENFNCWNGLGCEVPGNPVLVDDSGTTWAATLPSLFIADPAEVQGGTCIPSAPTMLEPYEPKPIERLEGCFPSHTSECDDGICVPAAQADQAMCIFTTGDVDCPADWPEKTVVHDEFVDERGCTPCGCEAPTGLSCADADVRFYDGGALLGTLQADGGCHNVAVGQDADHATLTEGPSGGSCDPVPGEVVGEVVPIEPTTVCCQA